MAGNDGLPLYVGLLVGNNSCKLFLPLISLKGWHCKSFVYILSQIFLSTDHYQARGFVGGKKLEMP